MIPERLFKQFLVHWITMTTADPYQPWGIFATGVAINEAQRANFLEGARKADANCLYYAHGHALKEE
jgi:hypothetical protein